MGSEILGSSRYWIINHVLIFDDMDLFVFCFEVFSFSIVTTRQTVFFFFTHWDRLLYIVDDFRDVKH